MLLRNFATKRDRGFGVATMADGWVLLFPLTVYMTYLFVVAMMEYEEENMQKDTEKHGLVNNDSLNYGSSKTFQKEGGGPMEMYFRRSTKLDFPEEEELKEGGEREFEGGISNTNSNPNRYR